MQPQGLSLCTDNPARTHRAVHALEKFPLEKDLSRAYRIGGVDNNGVVGAFLRLLDVFPPVANVDWRENEVMERKKGLSFLTSYSFSY